MLTGHAHPTVININYIITPLIAITNHYGYSGLIPFSHVIFAFERNSADRRVVMMTALLPPSPTPS